MQVQQRVFGIRGIRFINPFSPSVLFVGHEQTVQTQIRRRKTRGLIRVSTVSLQNVLTKVDTTCLISFADRSKAVLLLWIIYVISFLFLLCLRECLLIDVLWSPTGKGLTSWLSFVMSNCEVVTFPLVSWVRCCA